MCTKTLGSEGMVFVEGGRSKVKDTEVLGGAVLCCW